MIIYVYLPSYQEHFLFALQFLAQYLAHTSCFINKCSMKVCWVHNRTNMSDSGLGQLLFLTAPHGWFLVDIAYISLSPLHRWEKLDVKRSRDWIQASQGGTEEEGRSEPGASGGIHRCAAVFWSIPFVQSRTQPPYPVLLSPLALGQRVGTLFSALGEPFTCHHQILVTLQEVDELICKPL